MHRTQILLEENQYHRIKSLAERQRRSLSSVVRDAVTAYLARQPGVVTELREMAAVGDDPEARGRDHDEFLYRPRNKRR